MFERIDHVEIVTDQFDRTVEFYTEAKARDRIERSSLGRVPGTGRHRHRTDLVRGCCCRGGAMERASRVPHDRA